MVLIKPLRDSNLSLKLDKSGLASILCTAFVILSSHNSVLSSEHSIFLLLQARAFHNSLQNMVRSVTEQYPTASVIFSVLGFLLLWWNIMIKSNLGRKIFIYLTTLRVTIHHWGEWQKPKAEATKECWFMSCSPCFPQFAFLDTTGPTTCPGLEPLTVGWVLPH